MFPLSRDTTQYLYGNPGNPFQLTASRATDNTLTTYSYDTSGNLFAFERAGSRYYVATDQLGSPRVVTDNAGTIVKQAEYDAWGVKLSDSAPAFDLPVGFAGGIPEPVTGLVRFGFRDYEPGTGRWVARDPILFEGGQGNLYGYVGNQPNNNVDPSGLLFGGLINAGEEFGSDAAQYYADIVVDPNSSTLAKAGAWAGGLFSSLWTPCTSDKTVSRFLFIYGFRNATSIWFLRDGSPAYTLIDYKNLFRLEKHMIGRGGLRGIRWHIDALWGFIRHWPHKI